MRRASKLCSLLLAVGLVYLALLNRLWLPRTRTIVVEVRCGAPCMLAATPDIGRGFLYLDTLKRRLPAGASVPRIRLPLTSSRVQLELVSPESAAGIRQVSEITKRGTVPLAPSGDGRAVSVLPLMRDSVPLAGYVGTALALLAGAMLVARSRIRERLAGLGSTLSGDRLATPRGLLLASLLLVGGLFVTASAEDAFHVLVQRIDDPPYWPISLFDPASPSLWASLAALGFALGAFSLLRHRAQTPLETPWFALGIGLVALVLTNALQGWQAGFVQPTAGDQTYYAESFAVRSVGSYLAGYVEQQAYLGTHARTHPPGAVLLYYALRSLLADPGVISLVLGASAFVFATYNVFCLARRFVGARPAALAALTFALLPAVQVYFIVSLEAVACACMTGALRYFLEERPASRWFGAGALLLASLLFSFAALFLVAVFFSYELFAERRVTRSLGIAAALVALLFAQKLVTGFDYGQSLRIASALENPAGFWLLSDPGSYLFTRLEDVAEVCLFASPLVLAAAASVFGRSATLDPTLCTLCRVGIGCWLLMLAAGAFKTGETARSCSFVYPFLVLPVAALDAEQTWRPQQRSLFTGALLAQTVLMQLVGQYYW